MRSAALLVLLAIGCITAFAQDPTGPENRGVVLYLTFAPELEYGDTTSYRGLSALAPPELAITEAAGDGKPKIAFVMLAFPPEARPEVDLVTFGLEYPRNIRIVRSEWTPECLVIGSWNWPRSREGVSIAYMQKPDTTRVIELGWIAFAARGAGRVAAVPHIDARMAGRVVSHNPPEQTPIGSYGSLGFDTNGEAPLPSFPGPELGATCVGSVCFMMTRSEAEYYRGDVVFIGEGTICGAEPFCGVDAATGGCCLPDGRCEVLTRRSCLRARGVYLGNRAPCNADSCEAHTSHTGGDPR